MRRMHLKVAIPTKNWCPDRVSIKLISVSYHTAGTEKYPAFTHGTANLGLMLC